MPYYYLQFSFSSRNISKEAINNTGARVRSVNLDDSKIKFPELLPCQLLLLVWIGKMVSGYPGSEQSIRQRRDYCFLIAKF